MRLLKVLQWLVLLAIKLKKSTSEHLRHSRTTFRNKESHTTDNRAKTEKKTFLILSQPSNDLGLCIVRQLQEHYSSPPCHIYICCPSPSVRVTAQVLKNVPQPSSISLVPFNPFGSRKEVQESALKCLDIIRKKGDLEADGILFLFYGSVGSSAARKESGLLPISEYKLVGNAIFLHALMSQKMLKKNGRVLFLGSESARGLPKMGIPKPTIGNTTESIEILLNGVIYDKTITSKAGQTQKYCWDHAYSHLSAISVLYMMSLSKHHPEFYFSSISPGMTQESLKVRHVPLISIRLILKLLVCRYFCFGMLKKLEIAQDVENSAEYFSKALIGGNEWNFPSGSFIGAKRGTSGPICDQTTLPSGKMFLDKSLQDAAFQAVQNYI